MHSVFVLPVWKGCVIVSDSVGCIVGFPGIVMVLLMVETRREHRRWIVVNGVFVLLEGKVCGWQ